MDYEENKSRQNNDADKNENGSNKNDQGKESSILAPMPGVNKNFLDQLRGGPLDKASVNYKYLSPDPAEAAQRLALAHYVSSGLERMVSFKPLNLTYIMMAYNLDADKVAVIAGVDSADVESWFHTGLASESGLYNIACAIGVSTEWISGFVSGEENSLKANCDGLAKELQKLPDEEITTLVRSFRLKLEQCQALDTLIELNEPQENQEQSPDTVNPFDKTDSELLISIYRSMDEPERQNLYRIVCLRSKELNALLEHHSQNILPNY
ncbi:hypothetical protein [Klebsiella grimontii]|uniref:hypothetical protein n=1 Tax=Klebsiella grimontii TaxID=2058152 RepID=UPI00211491F7|nr:hypothetical protein [Klebsiella grimontii]